MTKQDPNAKKDTRPSPREVRLPGFTSDNDVGLGDVITRVTSTLGVRSCDGCKRRAQALNRRIAFSGRKSR